ncbi:MAG: F0F1 ATP synthase subunit gamma, partial [Kineosporiaceae bacterium]
ASQLRVYRQRMRSVQATKQITRAMELIAASRIIKAQERTRAAAPYARAITRAVSLLASFSDIEHPLTTERDRVRRSAVLVVTSDRGLAGGYSSSVLREAEALLADLREADREADVYLTGRKAVANYSFREKPFVRSWTGDSDAPAFETAGEIGDVLVESFLRGGDAGGVDEIYVVFSRFVSLVTQEPHVIRLLPVEVVDEVAAVGGHGHAHRDNGGADGPADPPAPLYGFEPGPEEVLDALLPRYIESRLYACLLSAAASELASRQRAMKSATDNAEELLRMYRRLANAARQADITQEISEIVGGADALAAGAATD